MVQKASRLPTKTDLMLAHELKIKELLGTMRKRVTIQQSGLFGSTPLGGATPSAGPSLGGTGDFLRTQGDTMIGPIAFFPVDVVKNVTFNSINIGPNAANPPDYSTYVLVTGSGDLQFIDGAAFAGQSLVLQGTNQLSITVKNATILSAPTVVGDGVTQIITVTTAQAHGFSIGEIIEVSNTTTFDRRAVVLSTPTSTTFTYDLGSVGSATPDAGIAKNGNLLTGDGSDLVLDGTLSILNAPIATLVFDITLIGNGAWRVAGSSVAGAAAGNEFADNLFRIFDDFDPTSKLEFRVDGVPPATTVTWFVQGSSGTVALLDSGFVQIFTDNIQFAGLGTLDMNGRLIILDADGDSKLGALIDDVFTLNLGGTLEFLIQLNPDRFVDVFFKRIQNVNDPVFDLDAVNLRTLNNAIQGLASLIGGFALALENIFEFSVMPPPNVSIIENPPKTITETVTVTALTP